MIQFKISLSFLVNLFKYFFSFHNIRTLESVSDESAILESEPASLGLGPVFDVKFIQDVARSSDEIDVNSIKDVARMVALDDTNCLQV
jgi:hypothetical protein